MTVVVEVAAVDYSKRMMKSSMIRCHLCYSGVAADDPRQKSSYLTNHQRMMILYF